MEQNNIGCVQISMILFACIVSIYPPLRHGCKQSGSRQTYKVLCIAHSPRSKHADEVEFSSTRWRTACKCMYRPMVLSRRLARTILYTYTVAHSEVYATHQTTEAITYHTILLFFICTIDTEERGRIKFFFLHCTSISRI